MSWFDSIFGGEEKTPVLKVTHPKLGEVTYNDDGWWEGEVSFDKYLLSFWVYGDQQGMAPAPADDCSEVIADFSNYLEKAFGLLRKTSKEIGVNQEIDFVPTRICEFWRKNDDKGFSIYFKDPNRADLLWTVEFLNSEAKYAGCDT